MTGPIQYIKHMIQDAAQRREGLELNASEVAELSRAFDQLHDARKALADIAIYGDTVAEKIARNALDKMTL